MKGISSCSCTSQVLTVIFYFVSQPLYYSLGHTLYYPHFASVRSDINKCLRPWAWLSTYVASSHACSNYTKTKTQYEWPHLMPQLCFILIYILSIVLCLAVAIMLLWHLWSVCKGETSVEGQDHEVYRNVAKERGDVSLPSSELVKLRSQFNFWSVVDIRELIWPWVTLNLSTSEWFDTHFFISKLKNLELFFNIGEGG